MLSKEKPKSMLRRKIPNENDFGPQSLPEPQDHSRINVLGLIVGAVFCLLLWLVWTVAGLTFYIIAAQLLTGIARGLFSW